MERVERAADDRAAAAAGAARIAELAVTAVAAHGQFTIAVSGGRSPWLMLGELGSHDMPWEATTIYQVDERIGPDDDPKRNLVGLRNALPPGCPAHVVPMPVTEADLQAACAQYSARLPDTFDLVHLGLGPDGHTASLIPGDPVLEVTDADVALTGVYQDRRRMTLTYPRLARTAGVLWLVTGAEKQPALKLLMAGDPTIPAGRLVAPRQELFCDAAAWGDPR